MRLAVTGQLLGQRWSVHTLVIQEPVDTETAEHHSEETGQLEAHRVPQGLSTSETILPPELILGMELEGKKRVFLNWSRDDWGRGMNNYRFIEVPLVFWEVIRVVGILRLNWGIGQMGIVAKA